ncbi:retrovirus-related pol polyprotein from transposon TNT 1-94 [Tanacetum coccineum]
MISQDILCFRSFGVSFIAPILTMLKGFGKSLFLLIPSVRFTKLIIHQLKTKHNLHPRTDSPLYYSHDENVINTLSLLEKIVGKYLVCDALLTDDIKGAPYYDAYLEHVAKYQQHIDAEHGMQDEGGATESPKATKVTKPKAVKVTKPAGDKAPKPTSFQGKKRKLVKETYDAPSPAKRAKADEGVPEKEPAHDDEEADLQRALQLSLHDQGERTQGPARPMVIRETDSGIIQPLPDVQGNGKEKVVDEQAAHDLLTLHTLKQKSPAD